MILTKHAIHPPVMVGWKTERRLSFPLKSQMFIFQLFSVFSLGLLNSNAHLHSTSALQLKFSFKIGRTFEVSFCTDWDQTGPPQKHLRTEQLVLGLWHLENSLPDQNLFMFASPVHFKTSLYRVNQEHLAQDTMGYVLFVYFGFVWNFVQGLVVPKAKLKLVAVLLPRFPPAGITNMGFQANL